MDAFKSFSAQLTPLASRMQHTLGQAKQYAAEKIGNAESTPFSSDYTRIMEQFDKQINVLARYNAYLRHYVANEYNAPLKDELKGTFANVTNAAKELKEKGTEAALATHFERGKSEQSVSHQLARVADESADQLGAENPLGKAFKKMGDANARIGQARSTMDSQIKSKLLEPYDRQLNTVIANAIRARKEAVRSRLSLDAVKSRLQSAKPEQLAATQVELREMEADFHSCIKLATDLTNSVLQSTDSLKGLADLVTLQLEYAKKQVQILSSLEPEIDELQVTQEALRHSMFDS